MKGGKTFSLGMVALMLIIFGLTLFGCPTEASPFVGTWKADKDASTTVTFTDKSFEWTHKGETTSGSYTWSGTSASMTADGMTLTAMLDGNSLTIDGEKYTKQ